MNEIVNSYTAVINSAVLIFIFFDNNINSYYMLEKQSYTGFR